MLSFSSPTLALLCATCALHVSPCVGLPENGPGPECALPAEQGRSLLQISQLSTPAARNVSMATILESFYPFLCAADLNHKVEVRELALLCVLAVAVICVSLARCSRDMAATSSRSSASGGPSRATTIRLDALDGLRTLFTIHIIYYHRYDSDSLWWFSSNHEVTMFFMLSGFVQCLADLTKGVPFHSQREIVVFIARRLGRLCPAYYAAGLWIVFGLDCKSGVAQTVAHFLFLQTLTPVICTSSHWFAVNGPGWFVSALLLVSLFYPVFYRMLPRGSIMKQCFVLAVVIALEGILKQIHVPNFTLGWFAPVRALPFVIGMLVAQLARSVCASFPDWPGWGRLFDASLTMALLASLTNSPPAIQGMCITACFTLVCISCAGMAAYDSNNNKSGSFLEPLLSCRLLVAASAYSYGAYIYQVGVFNTVDLFKGRNPLPVSIECFVCTCGPWLIAMFSKHCLEDPLNTGLGKMMLGAEQPPDLKSASAEVEANRK
ncbi:unnamed protein product [Polarella glacialis]|uniref:Acyltransferase 3 domain-containing protein n=1 Tax=Polarella glacialis TaxID=89957 RepID=A0A813GQ58_POLGL|nr:unnamed protein product [Polarella glacialis]CAE8668570.1 unnamed protein product [Polarella glacialis]